MCYSKEVQLATGSIIILFCSYYYLIHSLHYQESSKKWLLPFLKYTTIASICIGLHLISEFFTLTYNILFIYKLGLLISILSLFFLTKAFESILNRNLHSNLVLSFIGLTAIYIFLHNAFYTEGNFYVKHQNSSYWASAWTLLFLYIHIAALSSGKYLNTKSGTKTIIAIFTGIVDISLILSIIYIIWGYHNYGVDICTDAPSIWCTFSTIQVLALPSLFILIPQIIKSQPQKTTQSIKKTIIYFIIALYFTTFLRFLLPAFGCLSEKISFK